MYYHVYIVDIVDIAMWTMYARYRVNIVHIDVLSCYIVHIVDIAIYEMNRNFGLFCLFVVGRDVLSMGVSQSVNTYHLRGVTTKTQAYASKFA